MRPSISMLAIAAVVALPSLASAGTGQCYNKQGHPVGPTYDTDHPNYPFLEWVKRHGGECKRVGSSPNYTRTYPQGYPHRYPNGQPSFYANPHTPSNIDDFGEVLRADSLLKQHYTAQGHSNVSAVALNQYTSMDGRGWRIFRVFWVPSHFEYVAVRRNRAGMYVAKKNYGSRWSQVVNLGR